MIKHFCDWCGKEINMNIDLQKCAYMAFPALIMYYENGEPTGKIGFDLEHPHRNEYELCLNCLDKIWRLRHDQA